MNVYSQWFNVLRVGGNYNTMHFFAGTGGDRFEINFSGGYLDTAHVKAVADDEGPELTVTFITASRVKLSRPIPVGSNVLIYRDTPKVVPLALFADGSILNSINLDRNAKQAVFVAAEMLDRFDTFGSSLETSVSQVSEAISIAQDSVTLANDARNRADAAVQLAQEYANLVRQHDKLAGRDEPNAHPASAINWAEFNATPAAIAKVVTGFGETVSLGAGRNLEMYVKEMVRVTDFPFLVQGNGKDESANVQKCLDYVAERGGGVVTVPPNMVIRCDTPLEGKSGVSIVSYGTSYFDFSHRESYLTQQDMGLMVYRGGILHEELLTEDAVQQSNKVKVQDASKFPVGSLVCLSMNDKGKWSDPSIRVTAGQMARVTGSFSATNNITLDNPIWETLEVSKGALIRKVRAVSNVTIKGMGFIGKGRPSIGPGDQGLKFFFGTNVHVEDCNFIGVDARSVDFVQCYGWSATRNRLEFDPLGELNEVSYAIAYSCSMFGVIRDNVMFNMRHGVVSSHLSRSLVNKYFGVSRFVHIAGNTVTGNYGDLGSPGWVRAHAGISTHTDAEFIHIEENTVTGCRYGINPRTWNISVVGNTLAGNPVGVYLSESYSDMLIKDNRINDCAQWIACPKVPEELPRDNLSIIGNVITNCTSGSIVTSVASSGLRVLDNVMVDVPSSQGGALQIRGPFSGIVDRNMLSRVDALGIRADGVGKLLLSNNIVEDQTQGLAAIFASALMSPYAYMKNNTVINGGSFAGNPENMSGNLEL